MIYLPDRIQIISHSVNKSEMHPALSEIAKFISLSLVSSLFLVSIAEHVSLSLITCISKPP